MNNDTSFHKEKCRFCGIEFLCNKNTLEDDSNCECFYKTCYCLQCEFDFIERTDVYKNYPIEDRYNKLIKCFKDIPIYQNKLNELVIPRIL